MVWDACVVTKLGAQAANVDVDAPVRYAMAEVRSQDRVDEELSCQDPTARFYQGVQEVELCGGQVEHVIVHLRQATCRVHDDAAITRGSAWRGPGAPQGRAEPRDQLGRRERLRQGVRCRRP